jgi:hypothetical protein
MSARLCSTCEDHPARFSGSLWDGFEGVSVPWFLCDRCAMDDVANGGVIGEDWMPLEGSGFGGWWANA